jgi:hypothetical protein
MIKPGLVYVSALKSKILAADHRKGARRDGRHTSFFPVCAVYLKTGGLYGRCQLS